MSAYSYVRQYCPFLYKEVLSQIKSGSFDKDAPVKDSLKPLIEKIIGPVDNDEEVDIACRKAERLLERRIQTP